MRILLNGSVLRGGEQENRWTEVDDQICMYTWAEETEILVSRSTFRNEPRKTERSGMKISVRRIEATESQEYCQYRQGETHYFTVYETAAPYARSPVAAWQTVVAAHLR